MNQCYPTLLHDTLSLPTAERATLARALMASLTPDEHDEVLYADAVEVFQIEGRLSVSLLQRRLQLGFTRATRLAERLRDQGFPVQ